MASIARHKTAIKRNSFSRPIRLAIDERIIGQATTVFDYGCGYGDDIRFLKNYGAQCTGWDPIHFPESTRQLADVVNLGYVVNVIENPAERAQTLRDAWDLATKVLIVSARLAVVAKNSTQSKYEDGYLTRIGTFQKLFEQSELKEWIDNTLNVSSVAAGPGIFYVFRDPGHREALVASRYRRVSCAPKQKQSNFIFEEHKPVFEALISFINVRGRLPIAEELGIYVDTLTHLVGKHFNQAHFLGGL